MAIADELLKPRPQGIAPRIYAFSIDHPEFNGWLKVGYTTRDVEVRVKEEVAAVKMPAEDKKIYKIEMVESAMRADGTTFIDKAVFPVLEANGVQRGSGEWFYTDVETVRAAVVAVRTGRAYSRARTQDFAMRREQAEAVEKTAEYFAAAAKRSPGKAAKFLWNAKMRFGKTFATYQLAKKMGLKRILILTFKPAVESAWDEDLATHVDFEGWQFLSRPKDPHLPSLDAQYAAADKSRPIVCFGSFQDFLGVNESGGLKTQHEWTREFNWDLVVFDEYHFGAWRDSARKLFLDEDDEAEADPEEYAKKEAGDAVNEDALPITTDRYLFLSGTPFRALNSGEFIEEQIFSWTYADEQQAKAEWAGTGENPYAPLPKMVLMTYKIPESIREIALKGEFDEFDLSEFFAAEGSGPLAAFKHKNHVQRWLDLIRGAYLPATVDEMRLGGEKRPPMPYRDARLLGALQHTVWYMPGVAACDAMENLLAEKQNSFYHDYKVANCSGMRAGAGIAALPPVLAKIGPDPLTTKSITLSCGKLLTGVTVRPWSGIFMLCNLKSPETYFQSAFRVQSPWTTNENGMTRILKETCYVFDFAIDRALKQIADYGSKLDVKEASAERKVAEFIKFLPVLAFDGASMRQADAEDILNFVATGTSATLLARRWESALLVNVDNETLKKLLDSKEAMAALEKIEAFRSLNQDLTMIINRSEAVKKAKKGEKKLSEKQKKALTDAEKEYKSKRREIQEKLIKFATRIPVFMYLTDFREETLKDVVTQLEPGLFKKVTGLEIKDFNLLVELNVFNSSLMNDAIFKFRRYEDSSLSYAGVNKHDADERVGGYDTTLPKEEFRELVGMTANANAECA